MDRPAPRFARTKIQAPRPRGGALIDRPALEARLGEALLSQPLVLICATAGYGKTAALARQTERLPAGTALAWVSADEGDDLHRLLDCLLAALEPFDPPWRTAPEGLVAMAASPNRAVRQAMAAELINTLDACEVAHGVIVLDDLHRIDDPLVHAFLDDLLQWLTPRWTLAIASRNEPPLALARLRALGELAEFRQADLAFERDETRALARHSGLDEASADAVQARTDGWPAGLRLGLNALRGGRAGSLATIDRHVFDYLAAEVLDRLPDELRDFLVDTSVLADLTAPRCAAVSGNPRAAQLLDDVERHGLFVSLLDEDEPTLRLHDLFRGALEQRLLRERPHTLPGLLRRAAAAEADPVRRLSLLLRAGEHGDAGRLLLRHGPMLLTEGAVGTAERLLAQFPAERREHAAGLLFMQAMIQWARFDFVAMLQTLQHAEAAYAVEGDLAGRQAAQACQALALNALDRYEDSEAQLAPLAGVPLEEATAVVVHVTQAWRALEAGDVAQIGPRLAALVDRLECSSDHSLWYRSLPLPRFNGAPGTAGPLQRYADGVLRLVGDAPSPLRAEAMVLLGWRRLWQGRLADAEAHLRRAQADLQWVGEPVNVRGHMLALEMVLRAVGGRAAEALRIAQDPASGFPSVAGRRGSWQLLYIIARVAMLCADAEVLRDGLARLPQPGDTTTGAVPAARTRIVVSLHAALAWWEGDVARAAALWRQALQHEDTIDLIGHGPEVRLWLALAELRLQRPAAAAAVLQPLFARVASEGEPGGVMLAGRALAELTRLPWHGQLDVAQQSRLFEWAALIAVQNPGPELRTGLDIHSLLAPPEPAGTRSDGLSPREAEVLAQIAAGHSNKLIARELALSPHTVKRHVANILDKLALQSRGQAAAWWRQQEA